MAPPLCSSSCPEHQSRPWGRLGPQAHHSHRLACLQGMGWWLWMVPWGQRFELSLRARHPEAVSASHVSYHYIVKEDDKEEG